MAACHASASKEAAMGTVAVQELYSGGGAITGRKEFLVVVHSAAAWRRLAPALQGQRGDWESLPIDWSKSVALVIQTPPGGDAAHRYHLTNISRSGNELEILVEILPMPGREASSGPWSTAPVLSPSLVIASADAAAFAGSPAAHLHLPGVDPAAVTIAHER
jgi:hypothetical protein